MKPVKSITVVLRESDLAEFLADTSDVDAACAEYVEEYERRLTAAYPKTKCRVEFGETRGILGHAMYVNEDYTTAGSGEFQDLVPWIEDHANAMVNDWTWLTVA